MRKMPLSDITGKNSLDLMQLQISNFQFLLLDTFTPPHFDGMYCAFIPLHLSDNFSY